MSLQRFVDAQEGVYEDALAELRRGRKTTHWIWFVFPQLAGLGRSATAQRYAIADLSEAQDYLAHPVLGARLREAAVVLVAARGSADHVLGEVDAMKVRSSMTLFLRAAPEDGTWQSVLDRFFDGQPDGATERLLAQN